MASLATEQLWRAFAAGLRSESAAPGPLGGSVAEAILGAFQLGFAAAPQLTCAEWSDRYRNLTPEEALEHGPYRTSRVPFFREPMERLSVSDPAREVAMMKGSQIGGSQIALNFAGYTRHVAPGPLLYYLPRLEDAKEIKRTRFDPMVETTAALRERFVRRGSSTLTARFLGGDVRFRGAKSPAAFRHVSARYGVADDLDGWEAEVGEEGDPIALLRKRFLAYQDVYKLLLVSTPTVRGISRIERCYLAGDQRRYHVPCRHCGRLDYLTWSGFRDFLKKTDGGHHHIWWRDGEPDTAAMKCGGCGKLTEERWKDWMFARAEWRPLRPGPGRQPSYQISGLYSPYGWGSWAAAAREFLEAKDHPPALRSWVNTILAETYEALGQGAEVETLELRREPLVMGVVPAGVGALVGSVDTQDDRLEVATWGYGDGEECWPIYRKVLRGNPAEDEVFVQLETWRRATFRHESGRPLRMECVAFDSGGHHSDRVYRYCKAHERHWVWAVRGGNVPGRPIIDHPTDHNQYGAKVFTICVDTAKELWFARLAIEPPAGERRPGYVHVPQWWDDELIAQATAERGIWRWVRGRGYQRRWEKPPGQANELLDLAVYGIAALRILMAHQFVDLRARAARFSRPPARTEPDATPLPEPLVPTARPPHLRRRRGLGTGWMSRLRR